MSAWARASTSRARIFSAPLTASRATCSRSCWRAACTSWSICAFAEATRRSPSFFACAFDSSMRSCAAFSAAATISCARVRASRSVISFCFCASASDERPRSASASPSAMIFCRSSIFLRTIGQTHRTETTMNRKNVIAWANNVTLRFIVLPLLGGRALLELGEQRIREREEHRQAHSDDERRVDQAQQQEHLRLQLRHQLRLARGALEKPAAHEADAHARAERTQADHQADTDPGVRLNRGDQLKFCVHCRFPFLFAGSGGDAKKDRLSGFRGP